MNAAETFRVESFFELFQRDVEHETSVRGARKDQLVFRFKSDHVLHLNDQMFSRRAGQQSFPTAGALDVHGPAGCATARPKVALKSLETLVEPVVCHRLQQVV